VSSGESEPIASPPDVLPHWPPLVAISVRRSAITGGTVHAPPSSPSVPVPQRVGKSKRRSSTKSEPPQLEPPVVLVGGVHVVVHRTANGITERARTAPHTRPWHTGHREGGGSGAVAPTAASSLRAPLPAPSSLVVMADASVRVYAAMPTSASSTAQTPQPSALAPASGGSSGVAARAAGLQWQGRAAGEGVEEGVIAAEVAGEPVATMTVAALGVFAPARDAEGNDAGAGDGHGDIDEDEGMGSCVEDGGGGRSGDVSDSGGGASGHGATESKSRAVRSQPHWGGAPHGTNHPVLAGGSSARSIVGRGALATVELATWAGCWMEIGVGRWERTREAITAACAAASAAPIPGEREHLVRWESQETSWDQLSKSGGGKGGAKVFVSHRDNCPQRGRIRPSQFGAATLSLLPVPFHSSLRPSVRFL